MTPPLSVLSELIDALDDDALLGLCQVHFPAVEKKFTTGQTRAQRNRLLLDHVRRHLETDALLAAVRQTEPGIFARFEPRLPGAAAAAEPVSETCDILVLAANPRRTTPLQLRDEAELIRQRLQEAEPGRRLRVHWEASARADELARLLLRHDPVLVHFSGHGSPTGDLLLEDAHGQAVPLSAEVLAQQVAAAGKRVECVVLNACFTLERADPLAERVRCVIGMSRDFDDESARRFAAGFYRGLAFGKDYHAAFELGRAEVAVLRLPDPEVPRFLSRDPDVLDPDLAPAPARPKRTHPLAATPGGPWWYPLWYGTHRRPVDPADPRKGYSAERDDHVRFGTCRVSVPRCHRIGTLGESWWRRWFGSDRGRLQLDRDSLRELAADAFWDDVRRSLGALDAGGRTALVFIHGYNVTFEDAALRAAQVGFDLQVPGLTAFYSWPSRGRFAAYAADEAAVEASELRLVDFLTAFVRRSGAERVHLIAHSMGNRGLLRALPRVVEQAGTAAGVPFGQVLLAAPDVDAEFFVQHAAVYPRAGRRTTLYVSDRDKALAASAILHGWDRAGYHPPVTVADGIDTVEASNVDLSWLGHGYYADARALVADMHALLLHDDPPPRRLGLRAAATPEGRAYWVIGG
jgi:esterase/lipase superfamily enzyme